MRSKLIIAFLMTAIGLSVNAGTAHEWQFKEGKGYNVVKDSVGGLSGQLKQDGSVVWTREDDHGSFLNFQGGTVTVPHHSSLLYPEGFIAQIRFSVNLDNAAEQQWIGLFSKGTGSDDGYSLMLKKDGSSLLLGLKGLKPSSMAVPVKLESNREYELRVAVGGGKAKIGIDGKLAGEFSVFGTLGDGGKPLCLGTFGGSPFRGNLYRFAIEPWSESREKALFPVFGAKLAIPPDSKFPELTLPDPEGTVKIVDFTKFNPPPIVGRRSSDSNWIFRVDAHFISPDSGILHPDNSADAKNIEYDPQLKGTYDLYVGIRAVDGATSLGIGLGDRWFRIDLPGQGPEKHWSMEQLVARGIDMNGRKVALASMRKTFYLGYLKFIPSDKRRSEDYPVFEGYVATEIAEPNEEEKQAALKAEVDAKIAAGNYVQRHYVEERPMPELTAGTMKRKFMVFPCNWMDMVFRDTVPLRDEEDVSVTAAGSAGETIRLALAVRSLDRPLQANIAISSPLRNEQGTELAAEITPSVVEYARKRTTQYAGDTEFMVMPHYMEPGDKITISAQETREFMLALKLADDARPGLYRGVVSVAANGQRADVKVNVKVHNFKLDKIEGYDIGFWNLIEAHTVRKVIADQAAYGVNSMFIESQDVLTLSGDSLETIAVDWQKSLLPLIAEEMKRHGMDGTIHFGTCRGIFECIVERLPAAEQEACYLKIIKQITEKARQDAWPTMVFHSVDEVLSNPAQLPVFLKELQWQKKCNVTIGNDHIWYKTSRPLQKEVDIAAPMIDVFVNRFSTRRLWYVDSWEDMMATAKERKVKLIAYNSNNALTFSQPAAMRFINGWFFRTPLGNNCAGQLYWVWAPGNANALDDLPDINWVYIIPPLKNAKGGPTYDLLGLQAGVTDLRYILTLENAIRRAKAARKDTADAEELLRTLSRSFDIERFRKESVFFESKWDRQFDKDGKRYASGRLNLPNGWSIDQYDINRAKIAAAIEALY